MEYDVLYTTGGYKLVGGGSDIWVRNFMDYVYPHLKGRYVLCIDRPDPYPNVTPSDINWNIDIIYRNNDLKWFEVLSNANRIHILHSYYHPRDSIVYNTHKIETFVIHVSSELAQRAQREVMNELGSQMGIHRSDIQWEYDIAKVARKKVWIGTNTDTPFHWKFDDIINIPNFYEFKSMNDAKSSNLIGYASRVEERKCPHYLSGHMGYAFTNRSDLLKFKMYYGCDFSKIHVIPFSIDKLEWFYQLEEWGIFHGAFRKEPFGYAIFQGFDYGNATIIEKGWCPYLDEETYPWQASSKDEFDDVVKDIESTSMSTRNELINKARTILSKRYNKDDWIKSYAKLFNNA